MPRLVVDRDSKVHMNECERLGQRLLGTCTSLPLLSVRRKTFSFIFLLEDIFENSEITKPHRNKDECMKTL